MRDERIKLFDGFTLDTARGCVLREGVEVHLRPQSYEVLKYLVEHSGHLVSKDRLIEEVWHGRAVSDGSLVKCIEEVREALGEDSKNYVRNVRGRGYIFDPGVEEGEAGSALSARSEQIDVVRVVVEDEEEADEVGATARAASKPAAAAQRPGFGRRGVRRKAALAAAVLSAIALAAVAAYWFSAGRPSSPRPIKSIAVLPFQNESGNPDVEYLSDGMTESLINSLSRLPNLSVKARSSVFHYKGREAEPQQVASELSVQAILSGRVVQRGDDLTLYLSLADGRNGDQLWGEQYNRKLTDLSALQSDISRDVSEKLRLRLTSGDQQRLTKAPTRNGEAYQLYLNALFYERKKETESLRKALDYYQRAIALDPNFALAYAGMSSTYTFLAESSVDAKEALARSKAAALKALELDETLADAHWALGNIKANEWDWAAAENQYKRAIELNPSLAVAHYDYAYYLSCMGRHPEALAEIKRAQELDPLNLHFRATEGFILWLARRYDEAIPQLQSVLRTEPDNLAGHIFLGYVYASKGAYPEAIAEYQKSRSLQKEFAPTSTQCCLGYAYAVAGKRSEALALLHKLKTTGEYVSPAELAILYVGLGDKEAALDLLGKAYEAHDLQLRHLKVDPHYDSLRGDPRFQDLLRRVGLAP